MALPDPQKDPRGTPGDPQKDPESTPGGPGELGRVADLGGLGEGLLFGREVEERAIIGAGELVGEVEELGLVPDPPGDSRQHHRPQEDFSPGVLCSPGL